MAGLTMVPVRCKITVGGMSAGTPAGGYNNHVLSFNVDKARGQPGTCNASMRVLKGQASFATSSAGIITISAGTSGSLHSIFYGYVKSITISPCREYPNYVIMSVTGIDALSKLEGRTYTRRCRYSQGTWVSIDGVVREGLRSSKLLWIPSEQNLNINGGQLLKQDTLSKTRGVSSPTAFEKMSTNYIENVPMFVGAYVDSPGASQSVGQPQPVV
jgi:hypothetical protein